MNQLIAWLKSHSITTHTVAAVFAGSILAYAQVPAFHALVLSVYSAIPAGAQKVVLAAIGLYSWYRNGQQTTPPAA